MATFTLLIDSPPDAINAHANAIEFAKAALGADHQINTVFFFQQGVTVANAHVDWPTDEWCPADGWLSLAQTHSLELVLCSAAAQRRGIEDEVGTLREGFRIGGLGELVMASTQCDRMMQF